MTPLRFGLVEEEMISGAKAFSVAPDDSGCPAGSLQLLPRVS